MTKFFQRKMVKDTVEEMVIIYSRNPVPMTIDYLANLYHLTPRSVRRYLTVGGVKFTSNKARIRNKNGQYVKV